MKKNDLNRMISLIDDEKLAASEAATKRRINWRRVTAIAACAALILSSVLILPRMLQGDPGTPDDPSDQPSALPIRIVSTSATDYYSPGLVANDTGFVIKTENGSKEALESTLCLNPPVEYTIEELETDSFLVRPADALPDNTVVSLAQVKDQKITESWAYQTKNELSVSGTYPRNGAVVVSVNSVIEIVLSFADVENFGEYVSFTPEISGKWEHLGKTWRFTPDKALEKDTRYSVSVRSGFKSAEMTNTTPFGFTFSTFNEDDNPKQFFEPLNASADGILTFRPDDPVYLAFPPYTAALTKQKLSRISMERLGSADEFLIKLENPAAEVQSTTLGDAPFTWQNLTHDYSSNDNDDTIVLNDTLPEGYYLARLYDMADRERSTVLLQVNRISAYALGTAREVLVWTAKDGELAPGLSVTYNEEVKTTDKDALVRFDSADNKKTLYARVGEDSPLIIGIPDLEGEYINGYIYTDRALYRENDLIRIWGYVPPEQTVPGSEFTVSVGDYETGYEKIEVVPDEFGCFTATYALEDHRAGSVSVNLNCNDSTVAYRSIEVQNYSGQYYSYEILLDKNYVLIGDTLDYDVRVTHLSGAAVPGKRVYSCGQWGETDENGMVHFSVPAEYWRSELVYVSGSMPYSCAAVTVQNGDGTEMNSYQAAESFYLFYSDTVLIAKESGINQYTARAYKLNFDSDVKILELSSFYDPDIEDIVRQIGSPIENASIHAVLRETKTEQYINGYHYDEYIKQNRPSYEYVSSENVLRRWTLTAPDGSTGVDIGDVSFKASGKEIWYHYDLELTAEGSFTEKFGVLGFKSCDAPVNISFLSGFYSYEATWLSSQKGYPSDVVYNIYAYKFDISHRDTAYAFGENADVTLYDRNGNRVTDGTVLRMLVQQDIFCADAVSADALSFAYPQDLTPNIYLTGAYFKDGVFWRIPSRCLYHDPEENELDVTVSSDRSEYGPGDEVTIELDVKNAEGKGIPAELAVSVVDEAALAIGENDADISTAVFRSISYPRYLYSSYQDPTLSRVSTGWGGGNDPSFRSNFADTAYFGTVITDENGHASVTFTLPDTVTAYRVTAIAVGEKNHVGATKSAVTVRQDFFIQHTEPSKVKSSDDLVVGACVIGAPEGAELTFTLKETSQQLRTRSSGCEMAYANFGKLAVGTYTVQISAQSGEYSDGVEYTVNIISTAQTLRQSKRTKISAGETVEAATSPVVVEICNTDTARYRAYIDYLQGTVNERLDTQIAGREAQILRNVFYKEDAYVPYVDYHDYRVTIDPDQPWDYLLSPLKNAEADVILTALVTEYWQSEISSQSLRKCDPFEATLLLAARRQAVLPDLAYLSEQAVTDRERLLVCLSYALLGDYGHAKESYVQTSDGDSKSLQALAATFIDRTNAAGLIDELIESMPKDVYLRFAVLSYLHRNTELISTEQSVTVTAGDRSETVSVKGLEIKRLVFTKEQASSISLNASGENVDVTYYYDTSLERLSGDNVKKDITASLRKGYAAISPENEMAEGDELKLVIDYSQMDVDMPWGYITVALPNNLRMLRTQQTEYSYTVVDKYDHLIVHVDENSPRTIEIPLYVACEGEYTFEPVVLHCEDQYHISEPFVYSAVGAK